VADVERGMRVFTPIVGSVFSLRGVGERPDSLSGLRDSGNACKRRALAPNSAAAF